MALDSERRPTVIDSSRVQDYVKRLGGRLEGAMLVGNLARQRRNERGADGLAVQAMAR